MTPSAIDLKIVGDRLAHYCDEVTPAELFAIVSSRLGEFTSLVEALRRSAARVARP